MKTILSLLLLCLTPVLAIAELTNSQLIGHWCHADEHQTDEYTFLEDGTFTGQVTRYAKVVWTVEGKWSFVGDTLNYEYTKSSLERIPVGTKDRDKLIQITRDYFIIEAIDTDGKRRKYLRVK